MSKVIDVVLAGITCDSSGSDQGNDLEVVGSFWGTTFNTDPTFEVKSVRDIFTFPGGPMRISPGQTIEINELEAFTLSTPSTEPATLNGKYLDVHGRLFERDNPPDDEDDFLGDNFLRIDNTMLAAKGLSIRRRMDFEVVGQKVHADFVLSLASIG